MSDPTTPIQGTIEVLLPRGESQGLVVAAATENDIPTLLRAIFGITAPPQAATAPAQAHAAWTTQDNVGDAVSVIMWPQATFDFTNNDIPRDGGV